MVEFLVTNGGQTRKVLMKMGNRTSGKKKLMKKKNTFDQILF